MQSSKWISPSCDYKGLTLKDPQTSSFILKHGYQLSPALANKALGSTNILSVTLVAERLRHNRNIQAIASKENVIKVIRVFRPGWS